MRSWLSCNRREALGISSGALGAAAGLAVLSPGGAASAGGQAEQPKGPVPAKPEDVESMIARRVDRFGAVAHVFSTYESRRATDDRQPFARGINSIQLFFDGKRWWTVTIFWDSERPGQAIPVEYLPKKEA